ncbi:MAG: hypothetical protein LKG91_02450 [Eubacterium sp.]|nr:hypothetical protein [Eubacterium sp.]
MIIEKSTISSFLRQRYLLNYSHYIQFPAGPLPSAAYSAFGSSGDLPVTCGFLHFSTRCRCLCLENMRTFGKKKETTGSERTGADFSLPGRNPFLNFPDFRVNYVMTLLSKIFF